MTLRVIDAGDVEAVRSQSLWHGIASAMQPDTSPTLSFCRPLEPYVCLGYHGPLAEIDREACRAQSIAVLRRQLGGGPVFIDRDQLFFQLSLPADRAPGSVERLYRELLAPAVSAFRALGVAAELSGLNDIAVDGRKICGTAAGRIDDGVTVVGNVIFRFPHRRMAELLALPSPGMREECLRLMRRHVASMKNLGKGDVDFEKARGALSRAYSEALGAAEQPTAPSPGELAAIERWDERMRDEEWVRGPTRATPSDGMRQVKVSAEVWVSASSENGSAIEISVAHGEIARCATHGTWPGGLPENLAAALVGLPAREDAVRRTLEPFGTPGSRVLGLILPGLVLR